MADPYRTGMRTGTATQSAEYDAGLRKYMLGVYNYMASGVLLTGIVAMVFANLMQGNEQLFMAVYGSPLRWVLALAPLGFILVMNFGLNRMSTGALQFVFWAFAAAMGLSLASIFFVYTDASIARIFFITAGAFGGLSLYGYTTKRNLSGMGTFLIMGLIGLIIASIVNIFTGSSMMQFVISVAGVLIFAGLTAHDTQMIKRNYYMMSSGEMAAKGAIMGAVSLYLDFVNLFTFLLQLFGDRE